MPHYLTTPKAFVLAYGLRHNRTDAEKQLWAVLRQHGLNGFHFRQQHAIGKYIVDFCASREKLIIELDGRQHAEQAAYDAERTAFLKSKGYRVIRFWNDEVLDNLDAVVSKILKALHPE